VKIKIPREFLDAAMRATAKQIESEAADMYRRFLDGMPRRMSFAPRGRYGERIVRKELKQ
jgi:outer membrane lipopolysaccharide assembly protein LptE/RlpB